MRPGTEAAKAMVHIRDILHRRADLSTFVVHLTRARLDLGLSAQDVLVQIIQSQRLEARSPFGWADDQDDAQDPTSQSQRAVCFSETPLEHIYALLGAIEPARQVVLAPYGLAFPKVAARRMGINPIWYVDRTPGQHLSWQLANTIDQIAAQARASGDFHNQPAAQLLPFIDPMGTWPLRQREFWWEREWRYRGTFNLPQSGVIWLFPEREALQIQQRVGRSLTPWIDPTWGLERIVAHLAGFGEEDVSPFVDPSPSPTPPF